MSKCPHSQVLLEHDQLYPFSLPPPLKWSYIEWKSSIFNSAKICSSFRVKPFETIRGEYIPTVSFFFRSNVTYSFAVGVHRGIFWLALLLSQDHISRYIEERLATVFLPGDFECFRSLKQVGVDELHWGVVYARGGAKLLWFSLGEKMIVPCFFLCAQRSAPLIFHFEDNLYMDPTVQSVYH